MSRQHAQNDCWLEISLTLPSEFAEPVTHLFSRYGDGRVFVSQTGDWDADDIGSDNMPDGDVTVFGYLKNDETVHNRKGMIDIGLKLMSEMTNAEPYRERIVSSEEWTNQTFPKIRVGKRIIISPWTLDKGIPTSIPTDEIEIYLSPGLAFGTGNHPTTRLCLKQIETDGEKGHLNQRHVLDVGCGSGVLAIAALKMGASHARCMDIDETAIRATRNNLKMSRVEKRARVTHGTLPHPSVPVGHFDYIFANITSRVLTELAEPIIAATKPGGVVIASGILEQHRDEVQNAFINTGNASIERSEREGDWLMMRLIKAANQ